MVAQAKFEIAAQDKTAQVFRGVEGNLNRLAGIAKGALAFAIPAASIASLALLVKRTTDVADALTRASRATGLQVEEYQALQKSASLAGVSQGRFDSAMQIFIRRVGEARTKGVSPLIADLKDYDAQLATNIVNSRDQSEAYRVVADAIAGESDATKQAAIANAAFGRGSTELVAVLAKGRAGVDQMADAVRKSGRVMDEGLVAKAEAAGDQLEIMGDIIRTKAMSALVDFLPDLQRAITFMSTATTWVIDLGKAFAHLGRNILGAGKAAQGMSLGELQVQRDSLARQVAAQQRTMGDPTVAGIGRASTSMGLEKNTARLKDLNAAIAELEKRGAGIDDTLELLNLLAGAPTLGGGAGAGDGGGGGLGGVESAAEKAAKSMEGFFTELDRGNRVLELTAAGQEQQIPLLEAQNKLHDILGRDLLPAEQKRLEALIGTQAKLNATITAQKTAHEAAEQAAKDAATAAERAQEKMLREQERAAERAAQEIQRPFENAAENIQRSFGDLFTDVFRNGISGFKSFANTVKDIFARLAGEIAALLIFSPAARGVLSAGGLGGLLSVMSGGANAAALLGGGARATGGGALSPGGGIVGLLGAGLGGLQNFGSDIARGLGGMLGSAGFSGAQQGLGRFAGGLNAADPFTTGISGFAGGLAGRAIFGNTGLAGTALSTVGGVIGSAFGPIGSAVGSFLGQGLGSLFGGGGSKKSALQLQTGAGAGRMQAGAVQGPFGLVGFNAEGTTRANDLVGPLAQQFAGIDQQIAALLSSADVTRVTANFAADPLGVRRKFKSFDNEIFELLTDRLQTILSGVLPQTLITQLLGSAPRTKEGADQLVSSVLGTLQQRQQVQAFFGDNNVERLTGGALLAKMTEQVDANIAAMVETARSLGVATGDLTRIREREIDAIKEQLGFGGIQGLIDQLTATTASTLPFATVLANAQSAFSAASASGDPAALVAAGQNLISVGDAGFASGKAGADIRSNVITVLQGFLAGNTAAVANGNAMLADQIKRLTDEVVMLRTDNQRLNDQLGRLLAA